MPPVGYENVFPLENATEIECWIEQYSTGHSSLWIGLKGKGEFLGYLYFSNVQYLSAPIGWTSADFKLAPVTECEQLLVRMQGFPRKQAELWEEHIKKESLVKNYNLYRIERPDLTIEILAGSVSRLNDDI